MPRMETVRSLIKDVQETIQVMRGTDNRTRMRACMAECIDMSHFTRPWRPELTERETRDIEWSERATCYTRCKQQVYAFSSLK